MAELVTNLNMADISAERRTTVLSDLAQSTARCLAERFPVSDGYTHQAKTFNPFKEWPNLNGHRLWVRRGRFWGYRVEVAPADFQCRTARVTLARFVPLNETLAVCAILPALALMAGLLVYVVSNWGTWKDYRDPILVLLGPPCALGLALFGILWFVSRPIVAAKTDKGRVTEETADLRQSLHGVLVATP